VKKSDSSNFHLEWRATEDGLEMVPEQGQEPRWGRVLTGKGEKFSPEEIRTGRVRERQRERETERDKKNKHMHRKRIK
jgi:hypothetical protein